MHSASFFYKGLLLQPRWYMPEIRGGCYFIRHNAKQVPLDKEAGRGLCDARQRSVQRLALESESLHTAHELHQIQFWPLWSTVLAYNMTSGLKHKCLDCSIHTGF